MRPLPRSPGAAGSDPLKTAAAMRAGRRSSNRGSCPIRLGEQALPGSSRSPAPPAARLAVRHGLDAEGRLAAEGRVQAWRAGAHGRAQFGNGRRLLAGFKKVPRAAPAPWPCRTAGGAPCSGAAPCFGAVHGRMDAGGWALGHSLLHALAASPREVPAPAGPACLGGGVRPVQGNSRIVRCLPLCRGQGRRAAVPRRREG